MLYVKRLDAPEDGGALGADKALVGEDAVVRISRLGLSLTYYPAQSAQWRTFPPLPAARAQMARPGTVRFGAFLDDRLIGCSAVCALPSLWGELLDLRVDAASRRIGAGRAMLGACQAWAEKQGCAGLRLVTTDQNPGMCQFAEHEGFRLQGMDRYALAMTPEEACRPLGQRACELTFYKIFRKG